MHRFGGVVLSAAALVAAPGCRSAATDTAQAQDRQEQAIAAAPRPADDSIIDTHDRAANAILTLGMTRPIGAQAALFSAKQLNAYLSKQLGGEVATKLFDNSEALGDALSAGVVDAAWLTPSAFVRASSRAAVKPIARLSRGGFTSYRSVFFVKKDSKADKLADAKGLRMGWLPKGSASGRAYPRAHLKRQKIDFTTFFGTSAEFGDHRELCQAVLDGQVDVAASLSDERPPAEAPIVDGCREAGLDPTLFKIIERTSAIPNDVVAGRATLDAALETRVREALLQMAASDDGRTQLKEIFRADGFGGVTDADFAPVREVEMFLDLN